jgi:hypothetical protein
MRCCMSAIICPFTSAVTSGITRIIFWPSGVR